MFRGTVLASSLSMIDAMGLREAHFGGWETLVSETYCQ